MRRREKTRRAVPRVMMMNDLIRGGLRRTGCFEAGRGEVVITRTEERVVLVVHVSNFCADWFLIA